MVEEERAEQDEVEVGMQEDNEVVEEKDWVEEEVQEKDESQRPVQQGVRRVPQVRQPVRRQQHPRHWLVVVQAEHEHEICDGVSQGRLLQAKEEQEALHAQLWRMRVLRYS